MAAGVTQDAEGNPMEGGKQVVEVEKIVKVEDKEKMKKLEKRLAKEKAYMAKKHDEEKKRILEQANLAEEERQRLLDELEKKNEDAEKNRKKQSKLLNRLKNMEEKVLVGNEQMKDAMKQEMLLAQKKAEVEE